MMICVVEGFLPLNNVSRVTSVDPMERAIATIMRHPKMINNESSIFDFVFMAQYFTYIHNGWIEWDCQHFNSGIIVLGSQVI